MENKRAVYRRPHNKFWDLRDTIAHTEPNKRVTGDVKKP